MQTSNTNKNVARKRKRKRRSEARNVHAFITLVVGILIVSISAISGIAAMRYIEHREHQEIQSNLDVNTIYNNIFVNGVNVGGLTKSEALRKLESHFLNTLNGRQLILTSGDIIHVFTHQDFGAQYGFEEAVDKAFSYAREGLNRERNDRIIELETTPHEIEFDIKQFYDSVKIRDIIAELQTDFFIAPVNASMVRSNGKFEIFPEKSGLRLDVENTSKNVQEALNKNESSVEVQAVLAEVNPSFVAADLNAAQSLLGTYSSDFSPGDNGRNQNLYTAIEKINGSIIYPDEIFSTNKSFGAMTYDNGYRVAPVIIGGKLQDGMGGGVCQVSSALYNALLFSELDIVERVNHSLKVGYADYAFDATLAGDYIDLKFRNNTRLPVTIEAYIENGRRMTVNIYGEELRPPTRRLEFINSLVETIPPQEEIIREDASIPADVRQVVTRPQQGFRYNLYKIVYDGNAEVERVRVNTSTYRAVQGEILLGTGQSVESEIYTPVSNEIPNDAVNEPVNNVVVEPVNEVVNQPTVNQSPANDAPNSEPYFEYPVITENLDTAV